MDLNPLPFEERVSLDGEKKAKMVRQLHEGVRLQIEKKNRRYASKANMGRKLVWVHMCKEWFPNQRKSKLQPRGDGPFHVLERINNSAYKIDLSGEYGVSATFNVADNRMEQDCFVETHLEPVQWLRWLNMVYLDQIQFVAR